jgi:hypothetical protein
VKKWFLGRVSLESLISRSLGQILERDADSGLGFSVAWAGSFEMVARRAKVGTEVVFRDS